MQNDTSEEIDYDSILLEEHDSEEAVSEIIDTIILNGAKILQAHYLETQKNSYATKTVGIELIMNSTWAKLPLGAQPSLTETMPDDDLELPKIDSWANGALFVSESMPLRTSHAQEHPAQKKPKKAKKEKDQITSQNSNNELTEKVENQTKSFVAKKPVKQAKTYTRKASKQNGQPLIMNRIFENTKRSTGKNITVDSDFNVIEIVEHKNFATSLIIPKVTTKKFQKEEQSTKISKPKRQIPIQRKEVKLQKKPLPKLLQVDNPSFDEDQQIASVSEKIVCAPGVTFKEGNHVKSKPANTNPNELTRSQYQEYLEEFKKKSRGDFLE